MSSTIVMRKLEDCFPKGKILDTSGNCFNLFMDFPTVDGRQAGVIIWEESVNVYCNDGQYMDSNDYYELNASLFVDSMDDSFRQHEHTIFDYDDITYDEVEVNGEWVETKSYDYIPNDIFSKEVMEDIIKTWEQFNDCFRKAMLS